MEELRYVLLVHAKQYPQMEPTDAVKLIYQNEFGGGHLIKNEVTCMEYLRREYAAIDKNLNLPLYESIGNGLVRVNLAAVKQEKLDNLGRVFIASAAQHKGSLESFCHKLQILIGLTEEGNFSFGSDDLQKYLTAYQYAGYPAVSHSSTYRQAYVPAYRVIRYCDLITMEGVN